MELTLGSWLRVLIPQKYHAMDRSRLKTILLRLHQGGLIGLSLQDWLLNIGLKGGDLPYAVGRCC